MNVSSHLDRYRDESVIAVGAHPDDLEVGAGGALARLAQTGARVVMAVLSLPGDPARRSKEAAAGSAALGCELRLISHDRRHVEDMKTYEVVAALDELVDELKPALMIAHAGCDHHRDHLLAGSAALSTQRLGNFDFWRYATTSRVSPDRVFRPSLFIDITDTVEQKLQAISAHQSQFGDRGKSVEPFRELARERGRIVGLPYAEAFETERLVL